MAAFSSILIGASLAATVAGGVVQQQAARRQANIQEEMVREQQKVEAQRRQAMELEARRRQLEIFRNQQKARSLALATVTAQGAGIESSALGGSYGQIAGQTTTNAVGVSQNLQIGRNIFDINSNISGLQGQYASAGSQAAFGGGLSSLGGALMSSAQPLGRIFASYPSAGGFTGSLGESRLLNGNFTKGESRLLNGNFTKY